MAAGMLPVPQTCGNAASCQAVRPILPKWDNGPALCGVLHGRRIDGTRKLLYFNNLARVWLPRRQGPSFLIIVPRESTIDLEAAQRIRHNPGING